MCKPNKVGWDHRWTASEAARLRDDERGIFEAVRSTAANEAERARQI